jgi:phosphoribosylglycinamide formyltransferase-1
MMNIALMASGTGSNVLNLLNYQPELSNLCFKCVIIDTPQSPLLSILPKKYPQLRCELIQPRMDLKGELRRREFEDRLLDFLSSMEIDWVLLAGFMRILSERVISKFERKIINIHPSLLPKYPGLLAYERAFQEGEEESGVTIHLVDEGVDTGEILLQRKFPRHPSDTLQDFIQRGKMIEWELYPQVLSMLTSARQKKE